ncbi:MAG: holo-ACP synthase [Alphaproteobacteria bacterium]|nr:holo-ACP synthase [Alphaproteobacteria bacterium]
MIIGMGSDLIDIRRVEKVMARFEGRFITRCFTPEERQKAERRRPGGTHIATYAKRFAAKEAAAKALGSGFNQGVFMRDIGVINNEAGAPALRLTGGALRRLEALTPPGHEAIIHLTLTDEPPLAQAHVLIEARAINKERIKL